MIEEKRPLVSIVIPTRDRPMFIEKAIRSYNALCDLGVEIIISDNSIIPSSSDRIKESLRGTSIKYVRPPNPVGMVDHWNFAIDAASGQFIGMLTDKTFPLHREWPKLLQLLESQCQSVDLVSWTSDDYFPDDMTNFFGAGHHLIRSGIEWSTTEFAPKTELMTRLNGDRHRDDMSPGEYSRGKICFGVYSRQLCQQMKATTGFVFHPFSPDYTSLSVALCLAERAIHIDHSPVVQINTDISNGGAISKSNSAALNYIQSVEGIQYLDFLPFQGLYSSLSNLVLHDLLLGPKLTSNEIHFDQVNWLGHIVRDLDAKDFDWSTTVEQEAQLLYLATAMNTLNFKVDNLKPSKKINVALILSRVPIPIPQFIRNSYRQFHYKGNLKRHETFDSVSG